MRLLLLTFYYPPDLSAGSFRAAAMTEALLEESRGNLHIDVVTTVPNRYHSLACAAELKEEKQNLTITRIEVPEHQSGMFDQARSFASFALKAKLLARNKNWDGVLATSSRLMTAALGAWIARPKKIPLYLDIRDLFTDTMHDLLAGSAMRAALPVFKAVERLTLKSAARINVVSPGFLPHVSRVAPEHEYRGFTNGIDEDFLKLDFYSARNYPPIIVYAGNMGDGQGLHRIIPEAATKLSGKARFRLIGDGGRRKLLEEKIDKAGLNNVEIRDPVPRNELLKHYREADFLLLHLNDHAAFRKVLPSKIFEYAATEKPILAGVSGCSAQFLTEAVDGAEVFAPCDAEGLVRGFENLQGRKRFDRKEFKENFTRKRIMKDMSADIMDMLKQSG